MSDMDVCGLGIVGTDFVQSTSHPTIIPSELSPPIYRNLPICNLRPSFTRQIFRTHDPFEEALAPDYNMATKWNTFHLIRF